MLPHLLIICGPSGAGKGKIIENLMQDKDFWLSRSTTTRAPRSGEVEDIHYRYVSMEAFLADREAGLFAESNIYNTNGYATPSLPLEEAVARGQTVILDIDINGAAQIAARYPDWRVRCVFVVPESLKELNVRLTLRGDDPADVEKRLACARAEYQSVASELPFINAVVLNANGRLEGAVRNILRMAQSDVWDQNRMDIIRRDLE